MGTLDARLQSALLWGAVGAMAFLALHQAYLLFDGPFLGAGPIAAVALVVFMATTAGAYVAEGRLGGGLRPPRRDTE